MSIEQLPTPETEKFEPKIIFDFIRHGETEYGSGFESKVKETGYELDEVLPGLKITRDSLNPKVSMEGRLTPTGEAALRESMASLINRVDRENEVLLLLSSPRARTMDSAAIVLEELGRAGVDVSKAREHKKLTDFEPHLISIIQFMHRKTSGEEKDLTRFWAKMWEPDVAEEMKSLGFEGGLIEVSQRMDKFIELIKRYARRYKAALELDRKKLRVIAVTHDIPMEQVLQREKPYNERESLYIRNAQIVELGVDSEGKEKIITD